MSTTENLPTKNPDVLLVKPEIDRDAQLGVEWLEGELGRATLSSMGVADADNKPTTLQYERERVKNFIEGQNQLNWMIQYQGRVVGAVWADLLQAGNLPSPSIHIMIGDADVRGRGVGFAATSKVAEYLEDLGHKTIYSRHLTKNSGAAGLLKSLGFTNLDTTYLDDNGLEWQNVKKDRALK